MLLFEVGNGCFPNVFIEDKDLGVDFLKCFLFEDGGFGILGHGERAEGGNSQSRGEAGNLVFHEI